jgi:hypothetical protein
MVDGLHIPIQNRTKKPLAIALSGVGRGLRWGKEDGGDVNSIRLTGIVPANHPPRNRYVLIFKNTIKKENTHRPELRNILQNKWSVLFELTDIMKTKTDNCPIINSQEIRQVNG